MCIQDTVKTKLISTEGNVIIMSVGCVLNWSGHVYYFYSLFNITIDIAMLLTFKDIYNMCIQNVLTNTGIIIFNCSKVILFIRKS